MLLYVIMCGGYIVCIQTKTTTIIIITCFSSCTHTCMYVCMYVCVCVYVCMYVCMHVCMYMYVCMYVSPSVVARLDTILGNSPGGGGGWRELM